MTNSNGALMNPIAVQDAGILAKLAAYSKTAEGALAPATMRAIRQDTAKFGEFCRGLGAAQLPATPDTVALFVKAMGERHAPKSVKRYIGSIAVTHRAAGLTNPCADDAVRFALKRLYREKGVRSKQASALNRPEVQRMIDANAGDPAAPTWAHLARDRALVAVAYDTLARRSELAGLDVDALQFSQGGSGSVLIKRSKTDGIGEGSIRFMARDTCEYVRAWIAAAKIEDGALFRSVDMHGHVGADNLDPGSIGRILKRMAARVGIDGGASGHSTRVGACQDLIAEGMDLAGVMNAGGWKRPDMPALYAERLLARRGAMARLAEKQGRL